MFVRECPICKGRFHASTDEIAEKRLREHLRIFHNIPDIRDIIDGLQEAGFSNLEVRRIASGLKWFDVRNEDEFADAALAILSNYGKTADREVLKWVYLRAVRKSS